MKKIFTIISLIVIISQQILVVTAYPHPVEYAHPDGTTLKPVTEITYNTANSTISLNSWGDAVVSSNANLASLTVSSGKLSPVFSPNTTDYTVNVDNMITEITIIGVAEDPNAFVSGNVFNAALQVGYNSFYIKVITQDFTIKMYKVYVIRDVLSVANLASLTVNPGTLTPVFSANTTSYTVNVANTVTAITITGVASQQSAIVAGNVSNAPLIVGNNNFTIKVTVLDYQDTIVKYYYVKVIRATSSNANLASLTVSSGTLSPVFSPNTTNYTVNVANEVTEITITSTAEHPLAMVAGNVSNAALNVGSNNFTITVTAEDNTTKIYKINVIRAKSSNANLASLTVTPGTLSPVFSPNTTDYTVNVANTVTAITITGVAEDANAIVGGNVSNATLNDGYKIFYINVLAQDFTTKIYTVTVYRSDGSVANLASLTVNPGTLAPVFSPNTTNYKVNVANTVTAITINGVAS